MRFSPMYLARWRCWRCLRRWILRFRFIRSRETPIYRTPHPPPHHHHSDPLRGFDAVRATLRDVWVWPFSFAGRRSPTPALLAPPPRAARPSPRAGALVRGVAHYEAGSASPCTQQPPRAPPSRASPSPLCPCPSPLPRRPDRCSSRPPERLRYSCPAPMLLPPRHPQVEAQQNQQSTPTSYTQSSSWRPRIALVRRRRGAECLTWRARYGPICQGG
ncbi:hypothetical protein C8F04DRAFT_1089300 [Mycena alexandri]|uniref:Uncharacterized protein n=1 Tax=Mycena alexandri TaxID=1745969 RepID=A0AAD6T2W7_9AGAR|nr:hypothetical protein C8F04DRAFT_1089300 [Mycena alexandri]